MKELLMEEIQQEINGLKTIELGTEKYKTTVDGLATLMNKVIELDKFEAACSDKEFEAEMKTKELEMKLDQFEKDLELRTKEHELRAKQHYSDLDVRTEELILKEKQLKEQKKDSIIKNTLTLASIIVPTALTVWGTYKSFEFEETGSITTIMGRGFINKLIPKK